MDAYRSPAGREAVHRWCREALDAWEVPHGDHELDIPVRDGTVRTHLTVVGEGTPRFVWLPGTATSIACTLPAVAALAERGAVWALDVPGQPGLSQGERPRRDATVWYSSWLEGVLDELARRHPEAEVTLVGAGIGGWVALSADRPTARARVLVSPGGLLPVTPRGAFVRDHTRWSLHASPASARALMTHLGPVGEPPSACAVEWLALVGRACKTIRFPRPLPQHFLERIDASPLTVLVGEDDVVVPPAALAATVARRASARVVVLDGCGHVLSDEAWARVFAFLPT